MVVGYSLGNRQDQEEDIQVLGEDDADKVTFSLALPTPLTRMCRNDCPYCSFHKKDNLVVPYSTIKSAKQARVMGAREALYVAGERPDKFPHIRATLDLWGFSSYMDYLYTVCELGFLEGLIPVVEFGFLSPEELKQISEIAAIVKIMVDSVDKGLVDTVYPKSPGKRQELRLKSLEWAGKLKFPTATGIMVGIGESQTLRKEILNEISKIHTEYGHIHEVVIQNFVPQPGTPFEKKNPPTQDTMLKVVETALDILPDDISVVVPVESNPNIEPFLKAGVRDLGRIAVGPKKGRDIVVSAQQVDFESLTAVTKKMGLSLQQRFPLKRAFIKEAMYSKKLGQVFDAYKYKIKKEAQEKAKESK